MSDVAHRPNPVAPFRSQIAIQPDRIKLLKFATHFAIGGTERHVMNLTKGLDTSRFELHLGCLVRWGEFLNEIEARKIPLTEYRIGSLYGPWTFGQQLRFAGYLKRHRIQIVHSYNFYANLFAIPAARLAGAPVIVASIRDTGAYLTPIRRRAQRLVCRLADRIVVNAEAVRQWLITDGYDPAKIIVIRNGVDLARFEKRNRPRLRDELELPPRAPVVAMLSRLNRLKGVEFFLEAAAIVAARFREARFLIVGDSVHVERDRTIVKDGAYRAELESCAARLGLGGRVVFTGFRLDVSELLSEAAVSVLPSLSEGLSNTLLESMATGVPVVATRVGGNVEVVEDGMTGLLVPPRDAAALGRAICRLLEDRELASRFGQAGRRRVAEYFSLARMVRETERLYLDLAKPAMGGGPDGTGAD